MFADIAKIKIKGGDGGAGAVAFHREKYVAAGGPDGGDGGKGGDVVFVVDDNLATLADFRYKRKYAAQNGEPGRGGRQYGRKGQDLEIRVPRGTVIREVQSGAVMADMSKTERFIAAKGGKGGWGNMHFATPTRQVPRFAKPGVPGEVDYTGLMDYVQAGCDQLGIETDICQSNHEGDLIDEIQSAPGRVDGIVLNPGGYAHYSVAILDALRLCSVPAVEVMLDAPDEREPFRKTDVVSFGCQGHFIGEGPQGYLHACIWLAQLLRTDGSSKAHIVM